MNSNDIQNKINEMIKTNIENLLDTKEVFNRITQNTMFNPISKIVLENIPPEYDIINTYEYGLEHIEDIVKKEKVLDETIETNIDNVVIRFRFNVDNLRIYSPGSFEHKNYSEKPCSAQTPNEALKKRLTYCALILGNINYSYQIININDNNNTSKVYKTTLLDKYHVNIPIPIGCKYCALRKYDPLTLIRSGEDMEGAHGFFIIQGLIKYLIPYYQKPYNSPLILKNEYDNQLSRMDCLYSAGFDYENSYYIVAALLQPKAVHSGRGMIRSNVYDFVFSLQMNDRCMNKENNSSRKKSLINAIPIKILFYAFGCTNDLELLQYINPDLDDYSLMYCIRDACLKGKYHCEIYDKYLSKDVPLDILTARYIIGEIILSDEYKKKIYNNNKDRYKQTIIKQVDRLLRQKFMPCVYKDESIDELYEKSELTDDEIKRINDYEKGRGVAICYEMGHIVRNLYKIGNNITPSMDKISLLNKRVRHGQQIENEYKSFHSARLREIKVKVEEVIKGVKTTNVLSSTNFNTDVENVIKQLAANISTAQTLSLINAFKGTVTKDKSKIRTNILTPKNQSFLYAMIREIVISPSTSQNTADVQWEHRVVHPSHMYFIDPTYSPESGKQVGRYQQPSIYTYLTTGTNPEPIKELIIKEPDFKYLTNSIVNNYIIKINGSTIGYIPEYEPVERLYNKLLNARRDRTIVKDASIIMNHMEGILEIWTDEGRLITMFVTPENCFDIKEEKNEIKAIPKKEFVEWLAECEHNTDKSLFDKGLQKGFITLYDPAMVVHNLVVAQTIDDYLANPINYNAIALPLHILSYVTVNSALINSNFAVRASYSSNHLKQSMGPTLRYPQLKYMDSMNVLVNPQIPLVRSSIYDIIGYNEKPMGNNVIIAFLTYCDNQEDSFIANRSSIEQGMLVADSYRVKSNECKTQNEIFEIPTGSNYLIGNEESYKKIDSKSSLPKNVGDKIYTGDVIIAKSIRVQNNETNEFKKIDSSMINDMYDAKGEANTRELRCVSKDSEINEDTKNKMVVVAQRRIGICGDKFNSCYAQKGTIGSVYDTEHMPYTKDGIRPDIIFNPPSIFSRNTGGQLQEALLGKIASLSGCPLNNTPYQVYRTTEEIDELFNKLGVDPMGYEELYDPETGRCLGKAFMGVMQYQRQQHLVEDKLNIRSIDGDVDKIFGMAVKGRKHQGGQSLDRMCNDAITASGAVIFNKDTHLEQGANITIAVCGFCNKMFTYYSKDMRSWICTGCGRHDNFIIKKVTPATMLINQIFAGMHIGLEYKEE